MSSSVVGWSGGVRNGRYNVNLGWWSYSLIRFSFIDTIVETKKGGRFNDYSVLHALLFLKNGMGMQSRIEFLGVLSTCSERGKSIQTSHSKYSSSDVILVDCSQPYYLFKATCVTRCQGRSNQVIPWRLCGLELWRDNRAITLKYISMSECI